jgi:hypothetical protein
MLAQALAQHLCKSLLGQVRLQSRWADRQSAPPTRGRSQAFSAELHLKIADERPARAALIKRQLFALLDCVRKTIEDCSAGNPAPIPYSASEGDTPHLASLFEAIRMQRNDAVHPMNATVSASSVRLLLHSFPYALSTTEKLRAWLNANPASL